MFWSFCTQTIGNELRHNYVRASPLVESITLKLPEGYAVHPDRSKIVRRETFEVTRYASLGESFASGPSAGDVYNDDKADHARCSRYNKAFGPQIADDERIIGPKPIHFDFIACSGSRASSIWEGNKDAREGKPKTHQAEQIQDNPEMVTLSIGGNDVGFIDLLDRCVYRFYQNNLDACRGCGWFSFDDCSSDCNKAMKSMEDKITGTAFSDSLVEAIKAIFKKVPRTRLFVTGYPGFWNHDTDYCDSVSFKLNCPHNYVLPLTKERRRRMNELTDMLNSKIKGIIDTWPTKADLFFVSTNEKFNGHRFCEEGVQEPSYRNPNIWFYPLEYWTGGQSVHLNGSSPPPGGCRSILDEEGDQGEYYACLMAAGALANNTSLDLNSLPNNSPGDGHVESAADTPDWVARVFHPNINGMSAYRDAIVEAYENYRPRNQPFQVGTCHISLKQTQELYAPGAEEFGWEGNIYDNGNANMEGCSPDYEVHPASEDYSIHCDAIKGKISVHPAAKDVLEFSFGDQHGDDKVCQSSGWLIGEDQKPKRDVTCVFNCG